MNRSGLRSWTAAWLSFAAVILLVLLVFWVLLGGFGGPGIRAAVGQAPTVTSRPTALVFYPAEQLFNRRTQQWLADFAPLTELLESVNRLPSLARPLTLVVRECQQPRLTYDAASRQISLCYGVLAYLANQFDHLAASPRERQLGVLDSTYVLLERQIAQILLSDLSASGAWQAGGKAGGGKSGGDEAIALDELTAVLPAVLHQSRQTVVLSGTQWLFNQGHPLGLLQGLATLQMPELTLANYNRLICAAYGSHPALFPFLASEVPQPTQLNPCPDIARTQIQHWTDLLQPASQAVRKRATT